MGFLPGWVFDATGQPRRRLRPSLHPPGQGKNGENARLFVGSSIAHAEIKSRWQNQNA
jgi:hypothetical protein